MGLFALVAPVREKVFLRGTQRSGAEQRDHKTNIYPPASSAWALSSLPRGEEQEDGPTCGSEGEGEMWPTDTDRLDSQLTHSDWFLVH